MATDLEIVRFLLDDLELENQLVTDEEIEAMLELRGNTNGAAETIARKLAVRFAARSAVMIDGLSVDGATIAEHYRLLAQSIATGTLTGAGGVASPFVSGISISAMEAQQNDSDRPEDRFEVGEDDDLVASANTTQPNN